MRTIAVLVTFTFMLLLYGCGDEKTPNPNTTSTTTTHGESTENAAADKAAFLKALTAAESGETTFSSFGNIQKAQNGTMFVLHDKLLYRVVDVEAINNVTDQEPVVTNVLSYRTLGNNALLCYCRDNTLVLHTYGGLKVRTFNLPEKFSEKSVTPMDYRNGYLLCTGEESTGLWLYNIAAEEFVEVSPHYITGAAMLDGVVYYGSMNALNAFDIAKKQTTVLCDPTDSTIAFPSFYGRTTLWSVAPPMDSAIEMYTYKVFRVDDADKWFMWNNEVLAEFYMPPVPGEEYVLACTYDGPSNKTKFYRWYRVDPVTGESESLYYLPTWDIYWPTGDTDVYWFDGKCLYKMPLPPAEER